ncbi:STAS/SEC14 domain-containing protein [Lentisphaerota bacterium WC36G]|nr:STAS/SEC14 domain-containing protein [Lentisphaerae bacterium WC36]
MITELKKYENGIFEVNANGEMHLEDLMKLRDFMDEMISSSKGGYHKFFGCLNLKNVPLPSLEFLQKDLGLAEKYKSYIGAMAVIGDAKWEKAWFAIMKNFAGVKIKFFSEEARSKAKKWINDLAK